MGSMDLEFGDVLTKTMC